MEKYRILYVDDLVGEHESFDQYIGIPLADKVEVDYSRSHIKSLEGYKPVIELVKEQKYDIAVVDINLSEPPVEEGDEEGIEVIETILAKHPETLTAIITAYPTKIYNPSTMDKLYGMGIIPPYIVSKLEGPEAAWKKLYSVIANRFFPKVEFIRKAKSERAVYPLYETTIIHKPSLTDPIGVVLKKNEIVAKFTLEAPGMTLRLIAEKAPYFVRQRDVILHAQRTLRVSREKYYRINMEYRKEILENATVSLSGQYIKGETPRCDLHDDELCPYAQGGLVSKEGDMGYQCSKKVGYCVKELYFAETFTDLEKQVTPTMIRNHIRTIQSEVTNLNKEFGSYDIGDANFESCEHAESNEKRIFCGKCFLVHERQKGWALASFPPDWILLSETESVERALIEYTC